MIITPNNAFMKVFAPTTWNKYTEKEKALINEKLAKAKEYYLGGE